MHWTYLDVKLADSLSAKIQPQVIHLLGVFSFSGSISAHHPPTAAPLHPQSMARQQVAQRAGGPAETTWAQGWAAGCRAEAVALSPRLKQLKPERIAGFTRGSQTRRFSKEFFQTFENFFCHSTQREAAKQYPKACQSTHRYQTQSAPLITRKPRR